MSNPSPVTPSRGSNAGRYLFVFLLGLVLGMVGLVMALRAWDARKDHFPEGLMHVQQWHMAQLDSAVKANSCDATATLPHLKALRMTAQDLENAFKDVADDERFKTAASQLRGDLDKALAQPPLNCPGVSTVAKQIGESCKACHQDFR
jgi:cytochrome c556